MGLFVRWDSFLHLVLSRRLHVAPLGGPYGFGVAQPPLGATMGHGLVRHGSAQMASHPDDPNPLQYLANIFVKHMLQTKRNKPII